jgi:hypothetical protein
MAPAAAITREAVDLTAPPMTSVIRSKTSRAKCRAVPNDPSDLVCTLVLQNNIHECPLAEFPSREALGTCKVR